MQLGDRALLHGELRSPESSFLSTSLALHSRSASSVADVDYNLRLSLFARRTPLVVGELVAELEKLARTAEVDVIVDLYD